MTLMALNAISQGQTTSSSSARSVDALITLIRFRYKDDSMKARVKATGEIVKFHHNSLIIDEDQRHYDIDELENIDVHDYWEKLLHQYAGMALQGMLSNPSITERELTTRKGIIEDAVRVAHALVEEMKEVK